MERVKFPIFNTNYFFREENGKTFFTLGTYNKRFYYLQ